MSQEHIYNSQPATQPQADSSIADVPQGTAMQYLRSLPRNLERPALESYKRSRDSRIVDAEVAEDFTTKFRSMDEPFYIPVSWTLTKTALVKLLGITGHIGYEEVNGIRFYAGINDDDQLTLVAVSTMAGTGCNEDLTEDDMYPYYDFADPCPENCSNRGNLKAVDALSLKVIVSE